MVDIPDCRVLSPDLLRVTAGLRALLAAPPAETEGCLIPADSGGFLTAVDLREASDGRSDGRELCEASVVLVTLVLQGPASEMALAEAARAVRTIQGVAGVAANFHREGSPQVLGPTTRVLAGATEVRDRVTSAYHLATYGSFVQAHRAQAGRIQAMLASHLGPSLKGKKVLDLYGGSGALSLPLAALGAQVTLVESFGPAAEAAGRAAHEQGIRHFAVRHGDAALVVRELSRTGSTFDAVIANPPRRGLAPVVRRALAELNAPLIAYVSCDPETLARDLDHFVRLGYRTPAVAPVDMIPLTDQVETVAFLTPSSPPAPRILFEDDDVYVTEKAAHEEPLAPATAELVWSAALEWSSLAVWANPPRARVAWGSGFASGRNAQGSPGARARVVLGQRMKNLGKGSYRRVARIEGHSLVSVSTNLHPEVEIGREGARAYGARRGGRCATRTRTHQPTFRREVRARPPLLALHPSDPSTSLDGSPPSHREHLAGRADGGFGKNGLLALEVSKRLMIGSA